MRIPLDPRSSMALYGQIATFIRDRCRSGAFEAGMRLPSARELAVELGVSRITTEGAYALLESEAVVVRRLGSGTFVAPRAFSGRPGSRAIVPAWQKEAVEAAPARGLHAFQPAGKAEEAIDLSTGIADPALLPVQALRRALREAALEEGGLGYAGPAGYRPFRESIARVLSSRGIDAEPDDIIVTSGSQDAILLCALLALRRGGPVIAESPGYVAALGLFRALGLAIVGVPVDGGGMRVDALERAVEGVSPSLVYVMPNFQNPSGASLGPGRREALVALADRRGIPVLEDDFVGDLRYEGRDMPALVSMAPPGAVLYSGTFSKMLAPGLRVGYLVAKGPVRELLLDLKYHASLSSPSIEQRAMSRVVSVGAYENHVRRSRRVYGARLDALMGALAGLPEGFSAARPAGGLFAWLRLPEGLGAASLASACSRRGLLVFPGGPCFVDPDEPEADRFIRLNFASSSEERIVEGVGILTQAARVSTGGGR